MGMARKNKETSISDRIPLASKTGKLFFGEKKSVKSLLSGESKMIILTNDYPKIKRKKIEHLANIGEIKVPIYNFNGTNNDLSEVSSSNFRIGVISVIDEGKSELLS